MKTLSRFAISLPLSVLLLGGCAPDALGPDLPDVRQAGVAGAVDVSGSYEWTSVTRLSVPGWVAELFGIPVEGQITQLSCESSGTMSLQQDGASFEGSAVRTAIICETRGGVSFVPAPGFALPAFDIDDGVIHGLALEFTFGGAPLPTPAHGTVAQFEDGMAMVLRATGRTIVPGHPHSPIPASPPPAGTSKLISWQAVRISNG